MSAFSRSARSSPPSHWPIQVWLWLVAALIFCMVIVGGATRLTDSGLSITEWRPLLGIVPPLTEADWLVAFGKYQLIPEYQIQNRGMSLLDFKFIYWWEWSHRFLGRFIGFALLAPLVFFAATGRLQRQWWWRLSGIFVLGGLQGALGWYMVASGLSERVDVSQYRLAAHLTLAVVLYGLVIWTALEFNGRRTGRVSLFGVMLLLFLLVQVAVGGLVAGLDAGMAYNTWPKMDGAWIPGGLTVMEPAWRNVFENAVTVQFMHRCLAYVILVAAVLHWWSNPRTSSAVLAIAVAAQATLGILTLLWQVPISAALMHQAGALIVIAVALWHLHAGTAR